MELSAAQSYTVLGVDAGATLPEVRARYQILLQLFHPDRLLDAPDSVRQEAERRIREVNAAYQLVASAIGEHNPQSRTGSGGTRTPCRSTLTMRRWPP